MYILLLLSAVVITSAEWIQNPITWALLNHEEHLPEIESAFEFWKPLKFKHVTNEEGDININITSSLQPDHVKGQYYNRTIHISSDDDVYMIAVHEIGHALGLKHNNDDPHSIMYPYYYKNNHKKRLTYSDFNELKNLYFCFSRIDAVTLIHESVFLAYSGLEYKRQNDLHTEPRLYETDRVINALFYVNSTLNLISGHTYRRFNASSHLIEEGDMRKEFGITQRVCAVLVKENGAVTLFTENGQVVVKDGKTTDIAALFTPPPPSPCIKGAYTVSRNIIALVDSHLMEWRYKEGKLFEKVALQQLYPRILCLQNTATTMSHVLITSLNVLLAITSFLVICQLYIFISSFKRNHS